VAGQQREQRTDQDAEREEELHAGDRLVDSGVRPRVLNERDRGVERTGEERPRDDAVALRVDGIHARRPEAEIAAPGEELPLRGSDDPDHGLAGRGHVRQRASAVGEHDVAVDRPADADLLLEVGRGAAELVVEARAHLARRDRADHDGEEQQDHEREPRAREGEPPAHRQPVEAGDHARRT
jgi:hypothetical protein